MAVGFIGCRAEMPGSFVGCCREYGVEIKRERERGERLTE